MAKKSRIIEPAQRAARLSDLRSLKMARSVHAYVRGNTLQFYEWLKLSDATLPHGPSVWICGDCHISNLGPIADANGEIDVQIRDLDQTVIGNPAHDIIRLGVSLAMAARSSDLPGVMTAQMMEKLVAGYEAALESDKPSQKPALPASIKVVVKRAAHRKWKHLADERIEDIAPAIPLSRKFWPITASERSQLRAMMASEDLRKLATALSSREDDDAVEMLDAAYWVKGCSSLGQLRYAVLLRVGDSNDPESSLCLMDIKEAARAAAPHAQKCGIPRDNAQRVIAGAMHVAPNLGSRMVAGRIQGKSVFVRELLPQDLKIEMEQLDSGEAMDIAHYLGNVVGRAHAGQMSQEERDAWRDELNRNRPKTLDAPTWLWRSVVELVMEHEGGYLEHCRRYANSQSSA